MLAPDHLGAPRSKSVAQNVSYDLRPMPDMNGGRIIETVKKVGKIENKREERDFLLHS
jgi:hypothetical protein